jgi:hypothetical protein
MVALVTVLAHIGHWYHVFLYLAPVAIVAGGLWFAGRRLPDEGDDVFDADGEPLEPDARSGA